MHAHNHPCPHCGDVDCDTDCGERALIYREHRRNQMHDIELGDDEVCRECGGYIGRNGCYCDQEHFA